MSDQLDGCKSVTGQVVPRQRRAARFDRARRSAVLSFDRWSGVVQLGRKDETSRGRQAHVWRFVLSRSGLDFTPQCAALANCLDRGINHHFRDPRKKTISQILVDLVFWFLPAAHIG